MGTNPIFANNTKVASLLVDNITATLKYHIEIKRHRIKKKTLPRFFGSFRKTKPPNIVPTIEEINGGME